MRKHYLVTECKIISVVLLVLLMGFLYYSISQPTVECDECDECEICPDIIEDKAIIDVEMYDWGYNQDHSEELLFNYWIMNYGNVEAKNVKVICKLDDESYVNVFSAIDSYGNLASKSIEFGEFTPRRTSALTINDEYYSAYCYVESCDDCEILYKRIPEIIQSYE